MRFVLLLAAGTCYSLPTARSAHRKSVRFDGGAGWDTRRARREALSSTPFRVLVVCCPESTS